MRALVRMGVLVSWAAVAPMHALAQTPEALYAEGLRYHEGDGVVQDYARAAALMEQAAEAGLPDAQAYLGGYYFTGLGVERDLALALQWLEAAARSGDPAHLHDLAQVLESNAATLARAVDLYERAVAAGHGPSMVSLGVLYQEGKGVAQDIDRARTLYEGPAADGNGRALNNLGLLYVRGTGVDQDYGHAAQLFAAAAERGVQEAMTNLGVLYENGFGVPLDEARAAALYRMAAGAETGLDTGAEPTRFAYDPRLRPPPTEGPALEALRRAAEAGDPIARYQLGWLLLHKVDITAASDAQAVRHLRALAEMGHGPSMHNLGQLYVAGRGVPQDYMLGYMWLTLAADAAFEPARAALEALHPKVTSAQINDAQARAQSRKAATTQP